MPEAWKERCQAIGNLHTIKFRRVIQSIFYLLRLGTREEICEKYTNRLDWRKVRKTFTAEGDQNLLVQISKFQPFGAKDGEFKEYEKLLFIQSNIEVYMETEIQKYSEAFRYLFRWLKLAIDLRIEDIFYRKK